MPPQPTWFHRLEEIVSVLRNLEVAYLDRQAIERLFGVRERRARQLMAALPCPLQIGNAIAVDRESLLAYLAKLADSPARRQEVARHSRVVESLDSIRRHAAARRIQVPTQPDARDRRVRDLTSDIFLKPGELRIRFSSAQDLAAKLFELSQAMVNDWNAFLDRIEPP